MEIFLITAPGLEAFLADEARALGFSVKGTIPGGVTVEGDWHDVWRCNLKLRGATRVLARLGSFRAFHLAQLDKRATKFPWVETFAPGTTVRVDATCRASKIYHAKAAQQRVEKALVANGLRVERDAEHAVRVRIDDNLVTLSVDTSGEALHKRGHKQAVNKAPMRETLAALFLRAAGYTGTEPVFDPMCGSGTFPIEATEIALTLDAGRSRDFAFETLSSFDPRAFDELRQDAGETTVRFFGSDRDQGAVQMAITNAKRANVAQITTFETRPISEVIPPVEAPGLVIVNPPYGGRIGNAKPLYGLYAAFGARMADAFGGWRVALITSDAKLAKATKLPFAPPGPIVDHGGIKVRLWQTAPLN